MTKDTVLLFADLFDGLSLKAINFELIRFIIFKNLLD